MWVYIRVNSCCKCLLKCFVAERRKGIIVKATQQHRYCYLNRRGTVDFFLMSRFMVCLYLVNMAAGRREHENGGRVNLIYGRSVLKTEEGRYSWQLEKKKGGQAQYATSAPSVTETCNYKLHVMTDLLVRRYSKEVSYGQSILQKFNIPTFWRNC
jgi:hypothetical protein